MEQRFMFSFNNPNEADRFVKYPLLFDNLIKLEECSKFTELIIRAKAGLVLSQPDNFRKLDPDVFRETFHLISEIGQVLFDAF